MYVITSSQKLLLLLESVWLQFGAFFIASPSPRPSWCLDRRALDKTISDIEMRLAAARAAQAMSQGMSPDDSEGVGDQGKTVRHRLSFVMGVFTNFANRKRRDSMRQTWMPQGRCL